MSQLNVRELADELMDELSYYFDGYYMSGNGYEEVTKEVEEIINKYISK